VWPALLLLAAACARAPEPLEDIARALADGNPQRAWALAARVVESLPESADAHRLAAEAALLTLRTSPGVEAASRALELAPEDPRVHLAQAYLDQARLRNVAAIAAAREAVRLAPEDARYRVGLGELLFGGGMVGTPDYEGAEVEFREAVRLAPENLRASFGLAKALINSGQHDEGEAELDSYLEARPGHGEAHYLRGVARMRRRALDEAAEDFRRAIMHAPWHSAYWFNAARVSQLLKRKEQAAAERERFDALRFLEKNHGNLEVAYHSSTENVGAALSLARVLVEQSRFREGSMLLESLCADRPAQPEAHTMLAELCVHTGRVDRGREAAAQAIELAPNRVRGHRALAQLELDAGNPAAAVEPARTAASLEPDDPEVLLSFGAVLLAAEHYEDAAAHFERLRREHPRNLRARGGHGQALVGAGRTAEGISLLEEVLRIRPRHADWLYSRGVGLVAQGRHRWAEESFRSAVANDPSHTEARAALARTLREIGKPQEAKQVETELRERLQREQEIAAVREERGVRPFDADSARRLADLLEQAEDPVGAARARAEADTPEGLP
jgi:tetratricopeptide (TPR) repeat protein